MHVEFREEMRRILSATGQKVPESKPTLELNVGHPLVKYLEGVPEGEQFNEFAQVLYEQAALELCVKVAGTPDNVLYGSDYPHNIGDMAGCLARVRSRPAGEAARIAGRNAERLFRI